MSRIPPSPAARRHDPGRRDRIIDATLDVIAEHGVAGASHRRIAAAADVPLGSMTYHFAGMDELLAEAFTRLAHQVADRFAAILGAAGTTDEAREAIVTIITGETLSSPRQIVLSYELYTLAAREPRLRAVTQAWMARSRAALEQHFDPETARFLDALIEGLAMHIALDPAPMDAAHVRAAVWRITGAARP